MEGQLLGNRYEVIEKIGGGGMALVYKAKCQLLNRFVAVKILRKEFCNDEEFVRRFRIEAQAAASLSHPNIVSIFDVGIENDNHYIVMEFVKGITLKDHIKKHKVLPWDDAVNIATQICSAIEHAHRNNIVHRDIKPHNIIFSEDGLAKVTDFGIARAATFSTITMVGNTIGSVHYFSPEQARGGFTDEKSDIYSLGIVIYEMVTGKLPYDGDTPVSVALKHIQCIPEEPINLNGDIPKGLNDIILKAIEKEQTKRYQTADKLLIDLNEVSNDPMIRFFVEDDDFEDAKTKRLPLADIQSKLNEANNNGNTSDDSDMKIHKKANKKDTNNQSKHEEKDNMKERKRDKSTVALAIFTAIVISAMIFFGVFKIMDFTNNGKVEEIIIENYIGSYYIDVREALVKTELMLLKKENIVKRLKKIL
jgi:serine/threonine protein kinase